jgi:hypothetical protein
VDGYYRENPDEERLEAAANVNFYQKYGKGWVLPNAPHFIALALVLFGLVSAKRLTKLEMSLFSTGILMATMANFGSFISVFYNRTMANGGMYILATLILLLIRGELLNAKGMNLLFRKVVLWGLVLLFVPYLLFVASNMTQFTSIFMVVGTPAGFYEEFNVSLRQLLDILFLK